MPDNIQCTFFRDAHDRYGQRVATTWDALAARCLDHRTGEKDGPALSAGIFDGPRGNANLVERAFVALDIEANPATGEVPVDVEIKADYLAARGIMCAIWSTHSHTPDRPRYRVLLPLAAPIPHQPDIDSQISAAVAQELRLSGVADASKYGAASLFFLPRHKPGASWFARSIPGQYLSEGRLLTKATMAAQGIAQGAADEAERRRLNALPPEVAAKIEAYNATHPIPSQLERYGYVRDGNRWRSRYQHGIGATSILPDGLRITSFSESDAQAGVGQRPFKASSQCACWSDSFGLYCHYEFNNDFRAALAALGD